MVSFSVIIISNGLEDQLLKCLDSLRPPVERWQLILINNDHLLPQSVIDLAQTLCKEVDIVRGKSRKDGIEVARYPWLFFIEPAASVYPHYWEVAIAHLQMEKIGVLGGPDTLSLGMNKFNQALAVTLASPLCTGKTYYRHQSSGRKLLPANEEMLSTAHLWVRKESSNTALFYHPQLVVSYDRRETLKTLLKHTYLRGYNRSNIMKEKASAAGIYWLPSIFVLLHFLIFIGSPIGWDLAWIYAGLIVMMSVNMGARKKKIGLFPLISFLHYFIVVFFGIGFMAYRVGIKSSHNPSNFQ